MAAQTTLASRDNYTAYSNIPRVEFNFGDKTAS